jgi:hypothetical protein
LKKLCKKRLFLRTEITVQLKNMLNNIVKRSYDCLEFRNLWLPVTHLEMTLFAHFKNATPTAFVALNSGENKCGSVSVV